MAEEQREKKRKTKPIGLDLFARILRETNASSALSFLLGTDITGLIK